MDVTALGILIFVAGMIAASVLMEKREEKLTEERIKEIERQFYEAQANKKIDKYG